MPDQNNLNPPGERGMPFLRSMQQEMNQFLDRFRGQNPASPAEFFEALGHPLFPAIDVVETDDAIEVTAEIPGVKDEDLDITISQNMLVLKGEKSSDHEERKQDYHLVERRYGSFRRQVPLGFMPADGSVEATFADGILKLVIAKPEETRATVQKVRVSQE